MPISWFPGHMNKAEKELRKLIKSSDLIIELLDARAPSASRNPLLATIGEELPRIFILNKLDLGDPAISRKWEIYFQKYTSAKCLLNSIYRPVSVDKLRSLARSLIKERNSPYKSLQFIIIGIPNVGKSSFINSLCKRKITKTGNEPAVTKAQQRIKFDKDIFLVDTPGLLWPKLEDQDEDNKLGALGSIKHTAIDLEDVAWFIAEYLLSEQLTALQSRYSFKGIVTADKLFKLIAEVTGCLTKGGDLNYHKVAETLLNDLRSGKLGAISLEAPPRP